MSCLINLKEQCRDETISDIGKIKENEDFGLLILSFLLVKMNAFYDYLMQLIGLTGGPPVYCARGQCSFFVSEKCLSQKFLLNETKTTHFQFLLKNVQYILIFFLMKM